MNTKSITFYNGFYQKDLRANAEYKRITTLSENKSTQSTNFQSVKKDSFKRQLPNTNSLNFSESNSKYQFELMPPDNEMLKTKNVFSWTNLNYATPKLEKTDKQRNSLRKSIKIQNFEENMDFKINKRRVSQQISKYRATKNIEQNNATLCFDDIQKQANLRGSNVTLLKKEVKKSPILNIGSTGFEDLFKLETLDLKKIKENEKVKVAQLDPIKIKLKYIKSESQLQKSSQCDTLKDDKIASFTNLNEKIHFDYKKIMSQMFKLQNGFSIINKLERIKSKKTGFLQLKQIFFKKIAVQKIRKVFNEILFKNAFTFLKNEIDLKRKIKIGLSFKFLNKIILNQRKKNQFLFFKNLKRKLKDHLAKRLKNVKNVFLKMGFSKLSKIIRNINFKSKEYFFEEIKLILIDYKNEKKRVLQKSFSLISSVLSATRKGFLRNSLKLFKKNRNELQVFSIVLKKLGQLKKSDMKLCFKRLFLLNKFKKQREIRSNN